MTLREPPVRTHFAHVPPNWFATVMGTGILAVAAHGLGSGAALTVLSVVFWLLACLVYIGVIAATVMHWRRHRDAARAHLRHPMIAHFYGAVPMATLTVGTSTLVAGVHVIGSTAALAVDIVCFTLGTLGGVATALLIPARHLLGRAGDPAVPDGPKQNRPEPFGGWLMSVVPPMVSASAAAVLAEAFDEPGARRALLVIGLAAFVFSLVLAVPIVVSVVGSLVTRGPGPTGLAPTWWIVLGPLGQSVTAACLLTHVATGVTGAVTAGVLGALAYGYALTVWAAAVIWIVVATLITVWSVRRGLPFGLTWWSFTFPLGTFVTGSSAVAATTGHTEFAVVAGIGFAALLLAWGIVAAGTVAGIVDGSLLIAPAKVRGTLGR
ncbi:TDT family transporter [Gordonia oryzae]|uniref:TDT family transporter n=1 Tax=Gordonia oryzae TaxID=2487349 RepID=A0A3N4GB32_9ACTN|nr:TDT family transporter [Gordonia oryzae]RPA59993.1 TDT family transporter [Gordonia oryzae]